jgi:hypothetical protein
MSRVMTVEEAERAAKIEYSMTFATPELEAMIAQNPAGVAQVAAWIDKWFMSTGYTALCRELRKRK